MLGDFLQLAKSAPPIFRVFDVRDLVSVDHQSAFTPGRNVYCQLVCTGACHELLNRCSLANREFAICLPLDPIHRSNPFVRSIGCDLRCMPTCRNASNPLLRGAGLIQIKDRLACFRTTASDHEGYKMKTVSVAEAVSLIPDGSSLMVGGFMGVGTPERLIDELVRQEKRNLTIIANDTALPGRGIGKLVDSGLVGRTIASHIGLNPET